MTPSASSIVTRSSRHWWELLIVAGAIAVFAWLGWHAQRQAIAVDGLWLLMIAAASLVLLVGCGILLWKRTRFG
jgi:hypothetical protein